METYGLVVCRSIDGDGGWSLHWPDDPVGTIESEVILSGPSRRDSRSGIWHRPNQRDFSRAFRKHGADHRHKPSVDLLWPPLKEAIDQRHAKLVESRLVVAQSMLIDWLQRQPESMFRLSARQFEELVAELLTDRGGKVQLTPSSRDGGIDMFVYFDTGVSDILYLVETKRYRLDRRVGVSAVRQMQGVLQHSRGSQAMIVTTSSFTAGARRLEKEHRYQIALHDYDVLSRWIREYRNKNGNR